MMDDIQWNNFLAKVAYVASRPDCPATALTRPAQAFSSMLEEAMTEIDQLTDADRKFTPKQLESVLKTIECGLIKLRAEIVRARPTANTNGSKEYT